MPIIEVMKARGVVNCAVVVTRYFGGILLGAGGLVRAYAQGSKTALDAAGVVVMEKSARQLIEVDYSTWQRLEYFLRSAPVIIEHTEFGRERRLHADGPRPGRKKSCWRISPASPTAKPKRWKTARCSIRGRIEGGTKCPGNICLTHRITL